MRMKPFQNKEVKKNQLTHHAPHQPVFPATKDPEGTHQELRTFFVIIVHSICCRTTFDLSFCIFSGSGCSKFEDLDSTSLFINIVKHRRTPDGLTGTPHHNKFQRAPVQSANMWVERRWDHVGFWQHGRGRSDLELQWQCHQTPSDIAWPHGCDTCSAMEPNPPQLSSHCVHRSKFARVGFSHSKRCGGKSSDPGRKHQFVVEPGR